MRDARTTLTAMFDAALAAADPARIIPAALDGLEPPRGRLVVIGAGKASAAMARAVEQHWSHLGERMSGLVVTRDGHAVPCEHVEIVEAAHPVPDARGYNAARRLMQETVHDLTEDDLVLALISGGGSALLTLPAPGILLEEKQQLNRALLRSGASIREINCVRKHLSALKGGRLALACGPARLVTWLISDVPGDDPAVVASGPTLPDPSTCEDALTILQRYGIDIPEAVGELLVGGTGETPKPGDPRFDAHQVAFLATPQMALEAAAHTAEATGLRAHILSDAIEGEARDVAAVVGAIARQVADRGQPFAPPCVLLSGGETTVTVRGSGTGGRNVEFLTALALCLHGHAHIHALAADTDGIDGMADFAGAIIDPGTEARALDHGLALQAVLDNNDGHALFQTLGDSVVTGPTLTNVNDFRAVLIDTPA
ncbi:glycerate kinase [Nitrogeniibacter mangrovi]|uniref:Glycerate kinase n=1 Tax=Nitrogeniibacter mangrovi TaxID=2016596 RepID=A0A6C1B5Y1_9RHOO|nr:glycerate kinase [Nitrogeniibacter mangrovi]QID18205.1 glycerate kinase [Nitrogeniibacter mangrovi]